MDTETYSQLPAGQIGSGYLYLIGSKKYNWFKVGLTRKDEFGRRINAIQRYLPFELDFIRVWLSVPPVDEVESSIKNEFSKWRTRGEWFYFMKCEEMLSAVTSRIEELTRCKPRAGEKFSNESLAESEAQAFLQDILDSGKEVDSLTVFAEARRTGISRSQLNRARINMGVKVSKIGDSQFWKKQ